MSKILVADDEMIERKVLVKRLHAHCGANCDILEAENGRQVLEFWEREKPDVLILDIEMPGITGLAAAEMIRKKDRRLPIIFLTAFDEFDYARKAITVHALDYILKPYDQRELFSVVDEALDMAEFGRGTPDPAKARKVRGRPGTPRKDRKRTGKRPAARRRSKRPRRDSGWYTRISKPIIWKTSLYRKCRNGSAIRRPISASVLNRSTGKASFRTLRNTGSDAQRSFCGTDP